MWTPSRCDPPDLQLPVCTPTQFTHRWWTALTRHSRTAHRMFHRMIYRMFYRTPTDSPRRPKQLHAAPYSACQPATQFDLDHPSSPSSTSIRVVYVRTTLGATPSGTGVPDLRCAYPRQGISRRSCMLRRILLKVERGVRRRVCRLRSCLHIPGADQSSASGIPLSNAFLFIS